MRKLIKKHLGGSTIERNIYATLRQAIADAIEQYYQDHPEERNKQRHGLFAFRPVRYAEGVEPYVDSFTGKPILGGENILTRDGKIVTDKSLDWLDWLAETDLVLPGQQLPEILVELNKDTKETRKREGRNWDDMNKEKEDAPIATSEQRELLFLENFDINSLINQELKKRAGDRAARKKTPGVGSLALLATIGGMAAWDPIAFAGSMVGAEVGKTTLDYPFLLLGYQSFGDWLLGPNASETTKELSNLGTWLGGGFGWNIGKNITKGLGLNIERPVLLTDKYASLWAKENALYQIALDFLNNYAARMPQQIEDVAAVELSSYIPKVSNTTKNPNIFFTKTGETNTGSVSGASSNWQIRALAPGNPLEKRVNPQGLVSWKNIDWYLQRPSISAYDKGHITEALKGFPKDTPINYSELQEASKRLIPKFTLKPQTEYLAEGLDKINYGVDDIESMLVNSFHAPTVGNSSHYPDAFGHNRYFTSAADKDVLYVSEILNDGAQLILLYVAGDPLVRSFGVSQAINPQTIHMSETYPLRLIQEALLYALRLGKSKVRFPTRDTIYKIEKYDENIVLDELGERLLEALDNNWSLTMSTLESKYAPELKQLRTLKNQRFASYYRASERFDKLCRLLQGAFPEGKISKNLDYISLPDNFLGDEMAGDLAMLMLRDAQLAENTLFKELLDFSKKITEILETKVYPEEEYIKANQEYVKRTKYIEDNFGKPDDSNNIILDRYEAFPKHFRSLFGNKNDVRIVTDSKNNTWYEVDVPLDIATRSLLFSKVGEANRGSALSLAVNNLKKAFKDTFGNDPVWNLMERTGIPESLRANVEKTLFGPKIPKGARVYIDPATNVKYPLADPGMTDEELSKVFLDGLRDSYRKFRSPEYKTKLLLNLNWDESKYKEFIQELNMQLSSPFSVEVKGADELGYYFAKVVHHKDGSKTFLINRDRIGAELPPGMSVLLRLKEAGLHEGYHASTGGNDGSHGMRAMFTNNRSKYPRLTEVIDHNVGLLDDNVDYNEWVNYFKNTPKPLIVQDLKNAGFTQEEIEYALEIGIPRANKYNTYVDTALEFGARDFTSNFFDGSSENLQLLLNIFTENTLNSLNGKLLSKVGDINEGSAVGASRRPILRKNMHEFSDAEWDAAYEAALEKGNKREMWRLLTLRFLLKAKEYVATNGGDPMILWRGFYREPVHTMKPSEVWLSSDKNYALNYTKDKEDFDYPPALDELKVLPYFVKGHLETLFPHNTYLDLPESLKFPNNLDWLDLYEELMHGVPQKFRIYAENIDDAIRFDIENGATSEEIKNMYFKDPVRKRMYDLGKADIIVGHDTPVDFMDNPYWIPSLGIEFNVKNPNYVKLAKLITYDDNGKMIPLSKRFNFTLNDRRYGWLLPLVPFLLPNKKDQAE